jgi:hypothetical protein
VSSRHAPVINVSQIGAQARLFGRGLGLGLGSRCGEVGARRCALSHAVTMCGFRYASFGFVPRLSNSEWCVLPHRQAASRFAAMQKMTMAPSAKETGRGRISRAVSSLPSMTKTVGHAASMGSACGYLAALLALTAVGACSGRSTGGGGTMGSGAANQVGSPSSETDWPEAAPLPTPDIPPFPDLCSELKVELGPPGTACQPLNCPCTQNLFLYLGDGTSCASSVDCDALCNALADGSRPRVETCVGVCTSDAFCGGSPCVSLPGAIKGTCGEPWCLSDDDCGKGIHCVAVRPNGVRACASQGACNTTADCSDGYRCALPEQSFIGTCGDGRDSSVCYRESDCRIGWRCVYGSDLTDSPESGRCTSGLADAPCGHDDDCADQGKCFSRKCSTGRVNDGCLVDSDCEPGLQCVNLGITDEPTFAICTNGTIGAQCERPSQCAAGNYCSHGRCFNGSAGDYCDQHNQCQSERCLVNADSLYQECTTGESGSPCMDADDCLGGTCRREAGLPPSYPGLCD